MSFEEQKLIREIDAANEEAYAERAKRPSDSLVLATKALERSRSIGYRRGEGLALRTIASVTVKTNPKSTLPLVSEAIDILTEVGEHGAVSGAKMTLFCYYHHVGQYLDGFQALQEAYEQASAAGDEYIASMALYNMGVSCEEREDFQASIDYYEQCMQIAKSEKSAGNYWGSFTAVARLKSLDDPSDEAISNLLLASKKCTEINHLISIADSYNSLAVCYSKRGMIKECVKSIRMGRQFLVKTGDEPSMAAMLYEWGDISIRHGLWNRALRTFKRTLAYAKETGYTMIECKAQERLAFIYQQVGEFEQATKALYEYIRIKEELQSQLLENRMKDVQSQHKIEMARQEVDRANMRSNELAAINEELHIALEQQAHLQRELMRLASTDDLTGALNRRQVINDGILEMERYRHMSAPFSVTLIDIDHFKVINDSFGHAAGDEILRRLSKCCKELIRKFDVFGRLGGEEFCIIHHDTETAGAIRAVERLMEAISEIDVSDILGEKRLTVSMGVSEVHPSHSTFYDVLHDADMALYDSKHAGRNTYRVKNSRTLEAA